MFLGVDLSARVHLYSATIVASLSLVLGGKKIPGLAPLAITPFVSISLPWDVLVMS
jgi:hypothetical protein